MPGSKIVYMGNVDRDEDGLNLATATDEQIRHIRGNEISMIFQEPMTALNPVFRIGEQVDEVIALHDGEGKTAEDIKKYSLAKVESLFHILHEDGTVQFFEQPLDPNVFAKVVLVKEEGELVPIEGQDSMEKIKMVRTNAKKKVFVTNAIRSLAKVSPTGNVRDIEFVVLVGGSALDFEVPTLVTDALSQYNIVAGRGNIRGCEGPRNAVATGLAMSCADV